MRTPAEIRTDLDTVQVVLDRFTRDPIEVWPLVWEVIEDMLDSLHKYRAWDFAPFKAPTMAGMVAVEVVDQCHDMLTDYVANHYGD